MIPCLRPLLCFCLIACSHSISQASDWNDYGFKLKHRSTLAGIASSILVHELGHITLATLKDIDYEFDGLSIVYPNDSLSQSDRLQLASAGFQAQWIATEVSFHHIKHSERSSFSSKQFAAGIILGHLAITSAYLLGLRHHEDGDITGIAEAARISNSRAMLYVALPALLDTWRFFGKNPPHWLPHLSLTAKGLNIAAVWTF